MTRSTPARQADGRQADALRRRLLQGLSAAAVLPWMGGAAAARRTGGPPVAPREPVSETFFGHRVIDPYRWMENAKDPRWEPYMRGQDAYARRILGAISGRDRLRARVAQLSGGSTVVAGVHAAGSKIFYEVRPAGTDSFKLAVRTDLRGAERILIDPTAMRGPGGVHVSLDWWLPAPDGERVVYGLSEAGSENSVLHVMEVATGLVLPLRIAGTQYAQPSWLPDSSGFFYSRVADPAKLGHVEYYLNGPRLLHRLDSVDGVDRVVMVRGMDPAVVVDEREFPIVVAPASGDYALLQLQGGVRRENPLYVAPLADVLAGRAQWQPVCSLEDEVVDFAFDDKDLYLLSTRGAENGRVLRTPLAQARIDKASEVVPAGPGVIEAIAMARDGVYVTSLDGGYHTLRRLERDGRLDLVPLPWEGAIAGLSTDARQDGAWLDGTGWLLPLTSFHFDPAEGRTAPTGLTPPSPLDLSPYEARRLLVRARDGAQVPLSVLMKKGLPLNGRNPALVEAYGSYQIAINPFFSPRTLALLERGGVFAIAHVRGGGEYGRRWWKAGQKLEKPNTWRDLIDCCEYLIKARYASSKTLTIQGGSAGGITVGMALTERPDLFAGVISNVGVSNPLRAEFSPNGPPNIDEFGTVTDDAGFRGLLAMDATQHVRRGARYPAVLLTVGMTDPRVQAWEGAKMAAWLQYASVSHAPVLLRVNFDAGHGLGSTRTQVDAQRADEFAFVLSRAGRRDVG
ncbi:MAG: S9 family peptidase [Rubrivivax sp.]|nr:S9 family peptidase [Rubrivivax sp.]